MNVHKPTPPLPPFPYACTKHTEQATPSATPTVKLTVPPPARSTVDLSATPTVMATNSPSTLERWHIILIVVGVIVVVVVILGCTCILCYYWLIISKRSHISAEQKELRDRADKLEREAMEMANELPQDPDERKVKEDLISHKTQEASKLEERAVGLPQERYTDLLES